MKKILTSIMMIVLVCALIGTGVYAAFSDTETSTGNQFTAGTLDLEVDTQNPWSTVKFDNVGPLAPGDSGAVTCAVKNVGNLPGTSLTVDISGLVDAGELGANMDIVIWDDVDGDAVQDAGETTEMYNGTLAAEAGPYTVGSGLNAGVTTNVGISYSIDSGVGNEIQGDTCTFDIEFVLTQ